MNVAVTVGKGVGNHDSARLRQEAVRTKICVSLWFLHDFWGFVWWSLGGVGWSRSSPVAALRVGEGGRLGSEMHLSGKKILRRQLQFFVVAVRVLAIL